MRKYYVPDSVSFPTCGITGDNNVIAVLRPWSFAAHTLIWYSVEGSSPSSQKSAWLFEKFATRVPLGIASTSAKNFCKIKSQEAESDNEY